MLVALDLALADIKIETPDEFPVRPGRQKQRVVDDYRLRQGIMRVPGQDDIDAVNPAGQLAVHVETVMRQQDDDVGALVAGGLDVCNHIFLADAE